MKSNQTINLKSVPKRFSMLWSLLPLLLLLLTGNAQAQLAIKYPLSINPLGSYSSISGTGTAVAAVADDASENITGLPGFTVNGTTYTNARMNDNGWVMLYGATAPTTNTLYGTALSAGTTNAAVIICPFNQDLIPSNIAACSTWRQVIGNEIIFEWVGKSRYNATVANRTDNLNFQVRLNTVTGSISFVYGTMTAGIPTASPQVGWKTNGPTGANWATDINNLMIDVVGSNAGCTWANAVTGNANTSTMYLNAANATVKPNSGLTYTWTPQANPDPVRAFTAVTLLTGSSATVNWTAPAGAAQYNVQYRVNGACSWTNYVSNPVIGTSANITGLTAATSYQVRVQAQTAGGALSSIWSHIPNAAGTGNGYAGPGTFTTICTDISSYPHLQNMDNPVCWTVAQVSGTGNWNLVTAGANPTQAPIGAWEAHFNAYSFASGTQSNLVSRSLNLPTDLYRVSFKMYRDNGYPALTDRVLVYYNTAPNLTGATLLGTVNRSTALAPAVGSNGWYDYAFNMPAGSTGTGRYVIFSAISNFGNNIFLDEVQFEQQPLCNPPTGLTAVTTSPTTANISWTASSPAPLTGYEWFVSTSATPPGSGTAVGPATLSVSGVTVTSNVTNYLHVRAICGGGNGNSSWATYSFFVPPAGQIGVSTGGYILPINSCYDYSYSQQIYQSSWLAASLGAGNTYITKLRFYYQTAMAGATWDNWTIYMGNTAQNTFANTTNWIPVGSMTQVFSGALTLPGAGNWIEITLNTPFNWTPGQNLVIATDESVVGWTCTAYFGGFDFDGSARSILYFADGTDANPASPPTANGIYTSLNTIQLVAGIPPSCLSPTGLIATPTSPSTVNVSWSAPGGSPTGYEYFVSTSATPPGSGTATGSLSASGVASTPGTTNYLHVRTTCAGPSTSTWSTISFVAPCAAIATFPFNESFEAASASRPCWAVNQYVSGALNWTYGNGPASGGGPVLAAHGGTSNARLYAANYNYDVTKLVSPALNMSALTNPKLSFWHAQPVWAGDQDELRVYYKTSLGGSWNLLATYTNSVDAWTFRSMLLPSPSADYYIAFEGVAGYGYSLMIDDVKVEDLTCFTPTALTTVATSSTTANISWGLPVGGTPVGYEYEVSTSPTPPVSGTATGALSATGVTAFANVANYLHVRTFCGGSDYSDWVTVTFYTSHCPIGAVTAAGDDYITQVKTTGATPDFLNNSTFSTGYQDFTSVTAAYYPGYTFNLNVNFTMLFPCGLSVYVDWNNDFDFDDALEQIYTTNGWMGTGIPSMSMPINVPPGATPGNKRLRVVLDENSGAPLACGLVNNFGTYGEVEDYTITVLAIPSCGAATYATNYTTNTDIPLVCTGQDIILSSTPVAPVALNIAYRLEYSTAVGGPWSTVASQVSNNFTVSSPSTGFYRILTLCGGVGGSPVAATWTPVGVSLSDPTITSVTPASACGTSTVTLGAQQSPALASIAWYATPSSTVPLAYGNSFTTPTISSTTTYYVQAQNLIPTVAIGTDNTTTNADGITPYDTYYENVRTYYLYKKSELNAAGIGSGDFTSLAWDVTNIGGAMGLKNFTIRIATTAATSMGAGFATTLTSAFTTVYTNANHPIPTLGWNTIGITGFSWNGIDNVIIELCHAADVTNSGVFYDISPTVRYSLTPFTSTYSRYQDNVANCGLDLGTVVQSVARPNIKIGAAISSCNSPMVPVTATINSVPNVTGPGNQTFVPTIFSFNPLVLTGSSSTPGTTVEFTPASGIYIDNLTSGLYTAGTNVNGTPQYFAPLTTTTYSAVATAPNGCSANAPFTITVDASGLPNSACAASNIVPSNTLTFSQINTLGAVAGFGLPCGGIANQVWLKATVPASGEVHVVTKASGVSLTDLTASNIAMFTSTNCSTITNTSCNNNGGPGEFSYAYTQAPVGSTVYIRVAGLSASAVPNGKALIAVTSGLVWNPTNGDNVALAENWQGGDATAITTPSATQSIIIPANTTKPKLSANQAVRGVTINTAAPYYTSTGIDLNGFTLDVKGNWALGPVGNASTVLNCNGTVAFTGTVPQVVTAGKTTFGNLTLNNSFGLTLANTTSVACVLKTTTGTLSSAGFLVLRSTAANSAALVDYSSGAITGNVSVERKIGVTPGYHYLSAPVSGTFVNDAVYGWRDDFTILSSLDNITFVPGNTYSQLPTVWEYRENVNNPLPEYGYYSTTGVTDAITPLKGFACVVPANVTVDLLGPVNNGGITPYSVTLTDNGLNLLGNPYPSPISWNAYRTTNSTALSASGYKAFISSGGYAGGYGTWDGSVGTGGVTDVIASSQAFFATANGNTTVTAANNNRLVAPSNVNATFFGYTAVPNQLRMDIEGNGFKNEMVVYFSDARSDAYDLDATTLFSPTPGFPAIYSAVETHKVSINAMGKLDMDKVVPVGVKIQTAGTYNLVATDMTSFAPSVIAYLEDAQTGTITNLRTNPSYSVTLPVGDITNRFFIHFHPAVELNAVNETCAGNDGKLVINYPTANTVNVVIKDANGNVVNTQNNLTGVVTVNNLVAGNYVAEMTFGIAPNTYTTSDYFTVSGGNAVYANLSASVNTVDLAANTTVNFTATAQGATSFNWNFGDGTVITNGPANVAHTFAHVGTYNVTFEASNGICTTVATTTVEATNATGLTAISNSNLQVVGAGSKVTVRFGNKMEGTGNIEVINMLGEVVAHLDNVSMKGTREIELSTIAAGQYMVKITNNNNLYTEKVYLSRQ